ncbi:MAG: transcriptional regulator [Flavobacteriales bacterium TMED113]|nr:MAG: transcriptional regulator [Flavobacteriales bacterium TMED113]
MKNIKIVDTVSQYQKIKKEIDNAIDNVLKTGMYINGPEVKMFESDLANYLNVKNCISCANGTDALQIALMSLGLQKGDEVLIPTFTFISVAEVVVLLGYKPVFIDVDPITFMFDLDSIEDKITDKTKVIIPVHLFGQSENMQRIVELSDKYNLYIIEDNAQSLGSEYIYPDKSKKFTGTIGHIGTTSFYPSKNLGCFGDGGSIFTNNDKLADNIRLISNHGQQIKYKHSTIGLNSRLDSIQAAILRVKLKYLNKFNNSRLKNAKQYNNLLQNVSEIVLPKIVEYSTHVFHQFTIKINDINKRDKLRDFLSSKDIPSMIYYPIPIHKQEAYKSFSLGRLEKSEIVSSQVLSLPMCPETSTNQIEYISNNIIDFFNA